MKSHHPSNRASQSFVNGARQCRRTFRSRFSSETIWTKFYRQSRSGVTPAALALLAFTFDSHAIVNGTVVDNKSKGVVQLNVGCSGVMLNDEWVLTANHCIKQEMLNNPASVTVNGVPAKRIIRHPHGSQEVYDKDKIDIALIQLSASLPGISKFPVFYEGSLSSVIGKTHYSYGYGWPGGGKLRMAEMVPAGIDSSINRRYYFHRNSKDQIPSNGDSGGPSLLDEAGKVIVGIASAGGPKDGEATVHKQFIASALSDWVYRVMGSQAGNVFARDIPEECQEKLNAYALAGHQILCVAFPPAGGNRWTIVTDEMKQLMHQHFMGWDWGKVSTKKASCLAKGGDFPGTGGWNGGAELRSTIMKFDDGIQVVAVMNGIPDGYSVGTAVKLAYEQSWEPLPKLRLQVQSTGKLQISFFGAKGQGYELQKSTDLESWRTIKTFQGVGWPIITTNNDPSSEESTLYRLRLMRSGGQ